MSHIPKEIKYLPEDELREIIQSLSNRTWEEDALIRKLAIQVYGEDTVITMIGLAPALAMELEIRTRK
jgi:hypothetical protein